MNNQQLAEEIFNALWVKVIVGDEAVSVIKDILDKHNHPVIDTHYMQPEKDNDKEFHAIGSSWIESPEEQERNYEGTIKHFQD
jgi:hypothetical protein